ncbi:MAG: tetratricopeptide repeat protein [Myxococcota bacterium]|nr:tetratricopeptide repeat protein [Myxococcota bacterium]
MLDRLHAVALCPCVMLRYCVFCSLVLILVGCPRKGEEELRKGNAYFATKNYEKAAAAYEAASSANPKSARGPEARGNVAFEQGDFKLAETWYRKALEANPRHVTSRHKLALTLATMERFDDAIAELQKSVEVAADNPYALSMIGGLYRKQGKLQEAVNMQLRALDVDDSYHAARYALGNLLVDTGKLQDAERQFEILMTREQTALSEYGYARLSAKRGDAKKTAFYLNSIVKRGVQQPKRILDDPIFKPLWTEKQMSMLRTRLSTATSTSS